MSDRPTRRAADQRWPGWVYDQGEEPDYRFSFANERTFLAWIRTALALIAAGVAIDVVDLSIPTAVQRTSTGLLVLLGLASTLLAWGRWAVAERAMRRGGPLPAFGTGAVFVVTLGLTALLLLGAGL